MCKARLQPSAPGSLLLKLTETLTLRYPIEAIRLAAGSCKALGSAHRGGSGVEPVPKKPVKDVALPAEPNERGKRILRIHSATLCNNRRPRHKQQQAHDTPASTHRAWGSPPAQSKCGEGVDPREMRLGGSVVHVCGGDCGRLCQNTFDQFEISRGKAYHYFYIYLAPAQSAICRSPVTEAHSVAQSLSCLAETCCTARRQARFWAVSKVGWQAATHGPST